jgi:hypothetical protein
MGLSVCLGTFSFGRGWEWREEEAGWEKLLVRERLGKKSRSGAPAGTNRLVRTGPIKPVSSYYAARLFGIGNFPVPPSPPNPLPGVRW